MAEDKTTIHDDRIQEAADNGTFSARGGFPRVAPADMSPVEWQAWLDAWDQEAAHAKT